MFFGGGPVHNENRGGEPISESIQATPLIGYRSWGVSPGFTLRSLHLSYDWVPGENRAACLASKSTHEDAPPSIDCACGLYAQNGDEPIAEWDSFKRARVSASGMIQMYGRILRCARGFKAECAVIEPPIILDAQCLYRCDTTPSLVEVGVGRVWAYCAEHANEKPGTNLVVPVDIWLREASDRLAEKYQLEVLSWVM